MNLLDRTNSTVLCACGCGRVISKRAAKARARGMSDGYIKGHTWKGRTLPETAKQKMRERHADVSGENNPNYSKGLIGVANPNWQGGKKALYIKNNPPGRGAKHDRLFVKKIRERDGKCILCGSDAMLDVHHIEPWIEAETLRFDPRNCVTLCRPCHTRADNAHHRQEVKTSLVAYVGSL